MVDSIFLMKSGMYLWDVADKLGASAAVELSKTGLEYVWGDNATKSAKEASISTSAWV
jgi:hypothetical protein